MDIGHLAADEIWPLGLLTRCTMAQARCWWCILESCRSWWGPSGQLTKSGSWQSSAHAWIYSASAQAFCTTSNWIALVGNGDGLLWECKSRAGSKTVSALWCRSSWWCWAHDIWVCCNGYWAAEAPVVVYTWTSCFGILYHPGRYRTGCYCAQLLQGLQRVISDSVLFIYRCLIRRPVVGYMNRPKIAPNRLCDTSIIILNILFICISVQIPICHVWITLPPDHFALKISRCGLNVSDKKKKTFVQSTIGEVQHVHGSSLI